MTAGRGERGDWSYIASFSFALVLLAVLALALDAQAVAYARARLWTAVSVAARAGARCLAPSPAPTATQLPLTCLNATTSSLVAENLATYSLTVRGVQSRIVSADQVRIEASVTLHMPFGLPGVGNTVRLADSATATLLPATGLSP